MKKIYASVLVVIVAIIGILSYKHYENKQDEKTQKDFQQQVDKLVDRADYKVDEEAIYNGLLLANSKANPKRWNTYLYFPNQEQLLNNIPQCVEPTKADAELYLKAYQKVFRYLLEHHILSKSQSLIVIGGFAKQIVDFNYNYQTFLYFKELYDTEILQGFFDTTQGINENTTGMLGVYYTDKYADSPWHVNKATFKQVVDAVFTPEEQKELAKSQNKLLKQVSENCVQAGYGTDFYSIWWAGLSNQGVLGITTQSDMMYELFFDAYYIYNGTKTEQERQKLGMTGQVWDILAKNNDFIKRVIVANQDDNKISRLIFNTLTAEILQENWKNDNYSLPLRVVLFAKLTEAKYQNELASNNDENDYIYNFLQKNIGNQDYTKTEELMGYAFYHSDIKESNEKLYKKILKKCKEYDFSRLINQPSALNSFQYAEYIGILGICYLKNEQINSYYNEVNTFYPKLSKKGG